MEFFIEVSQRGEVQKLFDKMAAHFDEKPTIEFGEPKMRECKHVDRVWDGEWFESVHKWQVNVQSVKLNIPIGEYEFVADVHYNENVIVMGDRELFRDMPKNLGLEYHTCDICGRQLKNEAHILYSTKNKVYIQVGCGCFTKLYGQFKYFRKFMVEFVTYMTSSFGSDWDSPGGWRVPNHMAVATITFREAIAVCLHWRENVSTKWVKSSYDERCHEYTGTNRSLINYSSAKQDDKFIGNVIAFAQTLEYTNELDFYGNETEMLSLQGKQRQAADIGYIRRNEMYIAWFAIESYLDSIDNFADKAERFGYKVGEKVLFVGTKESEESYETDFGRVICVTFIDMNGIRCQKEFSNHNAFEKFMQPDGTFRFHVTVKYIAKRGKYVGFGGKLSK